MIRIPDKYRAESLVRAGFTEGDAEKVEAFARQLAAKGAENGAYEAGKRAYYEGAWPVPYEHSDNADAWYRGHAEASTEANDPARRSGSLLKRG